MLIDINMLVLTKQKVKYFSFFYLVKKRMPHIRNYLKYKKKSENCKFKKICKNLIIYETT